MKNKNSVMMIASFILVVIFVVIGITLTSNLNKPTSVISEEKALQTLDKLSSKINVTNVEPRKAQVQLAAGSIGDTLPDIDKYPITVNGNGSIDVEIFSSPEKAGSGKDGWLIKIAENFNAERMQIDGATASVSIRSMASGLGTDYITSGKYVPDAFSPSNTLWGSMITSAGIPVDIISERLVGNVPGILLSNAKYAEVEQKRGAVTAQTVTQSVVEDGLAIGYTNPFASSTGLNFLISALTTFDAQNMVSDTAIEGFRSFQANIPFVAYTTLQMRDSAKSGILDGFVMEYQTYYNTPELRTDYKFTPFGYRHDSPLYAIGSVDASTRKVLEAFANYCATAESQKLGTDYGFNAHDDYAPNLPELDGATIQQAQSLWKQEKDSGRKVIAVFVADTSGSMDGEPINTFKNSLLTGSQYINKDNAIGLVSFANDVQINLPIADFDINHRSLFAGAVEDLRANGSTAMYDGIVIASKMLMEQKELYPDATLMLFVLTDGEANVGHKFRDINKMMEALKIPIYTIGYNANIDALAELSAINEAASINADTEDVVYKLANLFNAQM